MAGNGSFSLLYRFAGLDHVMKKLFCVAMFCAFTVVGFAFPSPAEAQVVGRFSVDGRNPSGTRYAGTASVERTGDTYRVTWNIDGSRFIGTGIGGDRAIAISYRAGNQTGIALLVEEDGGFSLVWTYAGGTDLGTETWRRR